MTTQSPTAPPEAVGPLLRGVAVLQELSAAPGNALGLGGLARATGLARSTVDRMAATLARTGYLRLDGRRAALAPALMGLGNAYLAATRVPELLGPLADGLADTLDESVSIAVPDRDGIRFVHQATRRRPLSLSFRIGDLLPAERTAPGPLFAAEWTPDDWAHWRERRGAGSAPHAFPAAPPERRRSGAGLEERAADALRDGWALDDQLVEPGLVALAMPVRDPSHRLVCAVSVVSHTSRHSADDLRTGLLPALRETTGRMERALRDAVPAPAVADHAAAPLSAAVLTASKDALGAEFVESLARGLLVPTVFGAGRPALTLSEVAAATGLARASARRALITLQHLGYVVADGRLFRLTPKTLELGYASLSRLTLSQLAEPHLADLVAGVHDSASMAVLDGPDIRYIARVETSRIMAVRIVVGTRFPAYATAMGRVLLAGLPHAKREAHLPPGALPGLTPHTVTDPALLHDLLDPIAGGGHAVVTDELEQGLRSVAVPVRGPGGTVLAAMNVSMHSARRSADESLARVLPALRDAADAVESDVRVAGRFARIASV